LERLYTLGYVSGILGMLVALGLLIWTTWALAKPISLHKIVKASQSVDKLMRRGDQITTYPDLTPESPITPIVRFKFLVFPEEPSYPKNNNNNSFLGLPSH
jgi:hypothetical protein